MGKGAMEWDMQKKLSIFESFVDSLDQEFELDYFQDIGIMLRNSGKKLSADEIKKTWAKFLSSKEYAGKCMLSFYLHIPFCATKCSYCCYDSKIVGKKGGFEDYAEYLCSNFSEFNSIFKDSVFDTLYVGGGTPNILEEQNMQKIFSSLFGNFKFSRNAEKKIELNPIFNTKKKLDILKEAGFNKVSFGAQSLNRQVLEEANRGYQEENKVFEAVEYAKELGFDEVNVDLMFGLEGDTPESFIDSFRRIAELKPSSINVYKLQPTSYYSRKYLRKNGEECSTRESVFTRLYPEVNEVLAKMGEAGKKSGFKTKNLSLSLGNMAWGFKHESILGKEACCKSYTFFHEKPISCFGVGQFSQSHIFGSLVYKDDCREYAFSPESKNFAGGDISKKREIVNYLIGSFNKTNSVDKSAFKALFGAGINDVYREEIRFLKSLGAVEEDEKTLYLVPKPLKQRLKYFMFFLEEDYLGFLLKEKNLAPKKK